MRNLVIARFLAAAHGARFGLGIWVLYFLRHTTYAGIGALEAVIIVTAFLAEVPSGALADRLGRKRTLLLAFAFMAASFALMASAGGFWLLCLGCLVYALGAAFYSGTFEALVWDSLAEHGETERYGAAIAGLRAVRLGVLAGAAAAGGFLYQLSPRAPYVACTLVFAAGFACTLLLAEPRRKQGAAASMGSQMRLGLGYLRRGLHLEGALFFMLAVGMPLLVSEEILDDVLAVAFGFQPAQLGLLFAGIYLAAAAASAATPWLLRRLTLTVLLRSMAVLAGVSLLASPLLGLILGGVTVLFRYMVHAVWANLASEACNRHAPSELRATTLSLFAMVRAAPYVLLAWPIGAAIDRWSPRQMALLTGLVLLGTMACFWRRSAEKNSG